MSESLKAVEAEADAPAEGVLVPLVTDDGEVDILVPPPNMWFEGALEAMMSARISDWIRLATDDPETLAAWDSLPRKRYRDLEAFLDRWTELSGESPGKSQASKPSSRSTRRR